MGVVAKLDNVTLAGILDAAPDAMVAVDESGSIVLVNLEAERLFLYDRHDLTGRSVELLMPERSRAIHQRHRAAYAANPKPRLPVAGMQGQRSDGSEFLAEISLSSITTDAGVLVCAAIRDVTERLEAEAALARVKAEAERVLVEAEGDKAEAEVEKTEAERVRLKAEHVRLEAESVRVKAERDKTEAEHVRLQVERVRVRAESDKTEAERVRLKAESVRLKAESARLEAEAERERLESQLNQSQRMESLGQLAGGVAHDFNNLLAVILNYASFVAEEVTKAAESSTGGQWQEPLKDVEQIQLTAQRASLLTHQLLAFARREVVRPRVLNLNTATTRMEQILRRTIGEQVELLIDLAPRLPTVIADPGQIEQIILNLAINARDAMPEGGTLSIDTAAVEISEDESASQGARPGLYVRFRVSDSGVGMSPEVRDRAFEPFFTTKPKGEGSGLGLATVYGIVSQSGGYTRIYSEPGAGTTLTVLLPGTREDAQEDFDERADPLDGLKGSETILVVEDEDAIREVTRRILSRNGYTVLASAGGAEAIEFAETHPGPIDLVLTDVIMPKMQGKAVADEVSERRPGIRVLFMSGFAQPILGAEITSGPKFRLVEKPFDEVTLLKNVREVLDTDA